MAARGTQSVSLEKRNCALMEKIKCLQAANANLKKLNEKLQEENDVLRSTEEVLLRDNDKIKKKILKLKERHESLQDDIYTLEERLCSCTCPENRSNHEHKESKGLRTQGGGSRESPRPDAPPRPPRKQTPLGFNKLLSGAGTPSDSQMFASSGVKSF